MSCAIAWWLLRTGMEKSTMRRVAIGDRLDHIIGSIARTAAGYVEHHRVGIVHGLHIQRGWYSQYLTQTMACHCTHRDDPHVGLSRGLCDRKESG